MKYKSYLIFWLSQTVSQLGSGMTAYALALWAYGQTGRAMTVSLLTLCTWLPYVLLSPFAGALADRLPKKRLLLIPDAVAALGTLCALLLLRADALGTVGLCLLNALLGAMNALQAPASAVTVGLLLPREDLGRAAGLRAFGDSAVLLLQPALAAAVLGLWGMDAVFLCDLLSFAAAFCCVLLLVRVPETPAAPGDQPRYSVREGFSFLRKSPGLRALIAMMALMNLLSRLTYENILSPMLMARSGGPVAAGAVNSVLGLAGILGGLAVAADKGRRDPVRRIALCAALSFLLGDLTMGLGRSLPVWLAAGFFASFPIPFIMAGQNVLLYGAAPVALQGRVFAARNALQQSTVPVGLLLGGLLADRVFEPMMAGGGPLARALTPLVGSGAGSGMAVMFLCTGTLGCAAALLCGRSRSLRALARQVEEESAEKEQE